MLGALAADSKLGVQARRVWAALMMHYNSRRQDAWPSLKRLSEVTGMKKPNIVRAIRELEKRQYLTVTKKCSESGNRYNCYLMRVPPKPIVISGDNRDFPERKVGLPPTRTKQISNSEPNKSE
jgi:hypothetical protein